MTPPDTAHVEAAMNGAMRRMVAESPVLSTVAASLGGMDTVLNGISPVWMQHQGILVHMDLHRAPSARVQEAQPQKVRAVVVFQPGSGAHARLYCLWCAALAQAGCHVLAIDRPGHGLSGGPRGDCTVEEALGVAGLAIGLARERFGLPVVLMGSSMGGLLTVFGVLKGLAPDLAVAHNFLYPGKLLSFRLRARWIARFRKRPYPLTELVHGFEALSPDPGIARYLRERSDPGAAWELSARSVASLFRFHTRPAAIQPLTLLLTGDRDTAIPGWATRAFGWWSGLKRRELAVIPGAGHLLFHDHLDAALSVITGWLDSRLPSRE